MRIRRPIIVPAILTLGAVGSILAGSALPVAATASPSASVVAATSSGPGVFYHS